MKNRPIIGVDDEERMDFLYLQIAYLQEEIDVILAQRDTTPVELREGYMELIYPLRQQQQEYQDELDELERKNDCDVDIWLGKNIIL